MLKLLFIACVASVVTCADLIGTKQDCCRNNGANLDGAGNKYNGDLAKCEAGCMATENCNFFSHNEAWKACMFCSKCDLSSESHAKYYNSYDMKKSAPAPTPKAKETGSDLIGTKQDCCRYNGAHLDGAGNKYNGDLAKCEAGCKATENCNFFSHNKAWKACVLCSKCDLSSKSHAKYYNSYEMKSLIDATVVPQVVTFEIEVAGLTVADVQSSLQTYAQALADALGIDVTRVSLSISTSRRRLVEGNTGVTIVASVTASDTDTATASDVEAAVNAPTFATSVVTELQTAGVTVDLTVYTASITIVILTVDTCSVECEFNELIKVTHDTTSEHTHHRCYVDNYDTPLQSCVCECCDSATSDCTSNSNFSV